MGKSPHPGMPTVLVTAKSVEVMRPLSAYSRSLPNPSHWTLVKFLEIGRWPTSPTRRILQTAGQHH